MGNLSMNCYEVSCHCNNNAVYYSYGDNPPNLNWHNWIVTTNILGTKFYLDGNLVNSSSIFINNTRVLSTNFLFGACPYTNGAGFYFDGNCDPWDGSLDDIRIYNRALTQEEITYLATH